MDDHHYKKVVTLAGTEPQAASKGSKEKVPLLHFAQGVVWTPYGKVFVLDRGSHSIYEYTNGGLVKLNGTGTGMRNGPIEQALFSKPSGICCSATGGLLIADAANHAIRLFAEGEVTTFAGGNGQGKENGHSLISKFFYPTAVALNPTNFEVIVCDSSNNLIRLIANSQVSTLAGNGEAGKSDGPFLESRFREPQGLVVTSTGNIVVADTLNHLLRLLCDGFVTTLAGDGTPRIGDGSLLQARFNCPGSLCLNSKGEIIVADVQRNGIRLVTNGQVFTIAGTSDPGLKDDEKPGKAQFNFPSGVAYSPSGHILVADGYNQRVRVLWDDLHPMTPDFGLSIELHEKPEKFSLLLGDLDVFMIGRTWHLHQCIIQQRCPAVLKDETRKALGSLKVSLRGQKLFWLFVYKDALPDGQFGCSVQTVQDWVEIHELACAAQLDRLSSHAKWRTSFLLTSCESKATFVAVAESVAESFPSFLETLNDIIVARKNNLFGGNLGIFEKALGPTLYPNLMSRANLTVHPIPRPTIAPQGRLGLDMEILCPSQPDNLPAGHNICLSAEGKAFHVHSAILVPRWPLIFTWFYTRQDNEKMYTFAPKTMTPSALQGLLRYFYTGQLDQLKSADDCNLIFEHIADLRLTTESCGVLVAYINYRHSIFVKSGASKPENIYRCSIM